MRIVATIISILAQDLAADRYELTSRLRFTFARLATLLTLVLALGLAVAFQLLLYLPRSWREALLGEGEPGA